VTVVAVDVSTVIADVAAIFTIAAAFAGSVFALRYGRKANATVTGTAQHLPSGQVVISARVSVQSSGFLSLKIKNPKEASLQLTELVADSAGVLHRHHMKTKSRFLTNNEEVVPGETVTTVVEFVVDAPEKALAGWELAFKIHARLLGKKEPTTWDDTNFVPRPAPDGKDAGAHHGAVAS
jgi:hypothetical protein